jgi:hypothetical protein
MVYEKQEFYVNREGYNHEGNGILWKMKQRLYGMSSNAVNFVT